MERSGLRGVPTASHDDDDPQRVATMKQLGASMSEFPIDLDRGRNFEANRIVDLNVRR